MKTLITPCLGLLLLGPKPAFSAALTDTWTGLSFSRIKNRAQMRVESATALVLRADRDTISLKLELRPSGAVAAGVWHARLYTLPPSGWEETPDLKRAVAGNPSWNITANVSRDPPIAKATDRSLVPRATFSNWLLLLEPGDGAKPIDLVVSAAVVDEALRARQLMAMRLSYDPESQPERVRDVVTYLTDDEIRYWIGIYPDRRIFLLVWARMKDDEIRRAFPGERPELYKVGHRLPNGLMLQVATPPSSPTTSPPR